MQIKKILKQSVGIDVSKDSIAACYSHQDTERGLRIMSNKTFKTTPQGFAQMDVWLSKHRDKDMPLHLAMEATGVYYEDWAYHLYAQGYALSVLLPNRSAAFAKSLCYKSKTDRIDAQILAQMSLERSLPLWTPPSDNMLKIKRLCRERLDLLDEKTVVSNRQHAKYHAHNPLKKTLNRGKQRLKWIEKQVAEVEKDIRVTVDADPEVKRKIVCLCSIPGVAFITAITIVAETNGFALFKSKGQLVSFSGYDVVKNESGTSLHAPTRISKKGNSRIRAVLYFPAITAVRCSPFFKDIFNKSFEKSKVKMKAYVAVQRKILVLIYSVYQSEKPFDPQFESVKDTKKN